MTTYSTPLRLRAFTTGVEPFPLPLESLALPRQVHSSHVEWVSKAGRPEETDAVITDVKGLPLAIKTADCLALLLYDTRLGIIAAAHAGWRGTVGRIAEAVVKAMPSRPRDLHAILCPCISQAAFEVGDEVYEAFLRAGFPMGSIAARQDKWHVSLRRANAWLLRECGVGDIFIAPACTYKTPSLYSARRDGKQTGRNLNVIVMEP
ncbi:MAG: peptidoglycan editing factor PgeF [Prevotellaceae bacterium]|nr:peptidoglycan editing factor PgeF [Prevotellaceae bacterium]